MMISLVGQVGYIKIPSALSVHGPMVWKSLPDDLRAQQDYESFRHGLKTWLFSRYERAQRIRDFVTMRYINPHLPLPFTIT